jgi:hypothetical protein
MRNLERQRGEARLGTVVWILLFVAMVMISKEAIPVKIRSSQLQDFMTDLAKFSTREPDDKLQAKIFRKGQELELPLRKENVTVRKGNGRVKMKASYEVPLEFPFYTYVWRFEHDVDRPIFII